MDGAERSVNIVLLGVYWFLLAIALLAAAGALLQVNKVRGERPVALRVEDRHVSISLKELSGKRGKYKTLWATAALTLVRKDTGEVVRHNSERTLSREELLSQNFLEDWEKGATMEGVQRGGAVEVEGVSSWAGAGALAVVFWMFGTFAWMARPFAVGGDESGGAWKFLLLALPLLGLAGYGVYINVRGDQAARVAVTGKGVLRTGADFWAELAAMGVGVSEEAKQFADFDQVRYCVYEWEGRQRRTTSLWCQPGEDEIVPGRLNPANPRDVKWGAEP